MYLEPQGDSVTLSAPAFSAPPRGPFSRAHTDAVYPEGCRGDRSPDPSKFAAADRGLPTLRRPGTQKPRGPAAARPVPAPLGGSRGRRALAMLPSQRPTAALTPAPQPRGPAPDHSLLPANRPELPRSPRRPSPFTCSIAWPGTPLNRIRPLRVPNRTRRLLEPTRSCRDPRVTAPSSPAHWLSASRRLCAPLLLV